MDANPNFSDLTEASHGHALQGFRWTAPGSAMKAGALLAEGIPASPGHV